MIDANLFAPDAFADGPPHALFRRLRAEEPVSRQHEPDGREFWAVTRYADVVAVSKQPLLFSSHRMGAQLQDLPDYLVEGTRSTILGMDPPQHSKYRRLISSGFTPRLVQKLEAHIRKLTTQIIDRVAGSGACDFVHDIAAQLPLAVIAELLGVPEADFIWVTNAGAVVADPLGSTARSLALACAVHGGKEIVILGHTDCRFFQPERHAAIGWLRRVGVDLSGEARALDEFLSRTLDERSAVILAVGNLRASPFLPRHLPVHGLIVDTDSGRLDWVLNGYEAAPAMPAQPPAASEACGPDLLLGTRLPPIGSF